MTEVIAGEVARLRADIDPITVALSGPSHAEEVAFDSADRHRGGEP